MVEHYKSLHLEKEFSQRIHWLLRGIGMALYIFIAYLTYLFYVNLQGTKYAIYSYIIIAVLVTAGVFFAVLLAYKKTFQREWAEIKRYKLKVGRYFRK